MHMLNCVHVLVQASRGDKVHWESSSGVGIDGGAGGGVGDELQPASPDRLAPEGLHPGTELPLSG